MLTAVLDLLSNIKLNLENISKCIDVIMKDTLRIEDKKRQERRTTRCDVFLSAVDVICPSGRRRARAKLGGMCLTHLVFSDREQIHVLAVAPCVRRSSATSIEIAPNRCKRMVGKVKVLRWKSEERLVANCFGARAKDKKKSFLEHFRKVYVKVEVDAEGSAVPYYKPNSHKPCRSWTKLEAGMKGVDKKTTSERDSEPACGSSPCFGLQWSKTQGKLHDEQD